MTLARRVPVLLIVAALGALGAASADSPAPQFDAGLVVLHETGRSRDGLPVLTRAEDAGSVREALGRGFAARLARLYRLEQTYLYRSGGALPEPAYLLLSNNQGGFPRFGFYLDDENKRGTGYVDLPRNQTPTGRFGAMDQIFPHELVHVIVHQLTGETAEGGSNQVHAVGVRTDPQTAFSEGFAEVAQILAVDDPDAVPGTRALASDAGRPAMAAREQDAYARELTARLSPASPMRMRFPLWFSRNEQVLRYHAVRGNLFARWPARLSWLAAHDTYDAYLLANIQPGTPDGPAKPAAVALSTEGVVAHLLWRWVTSPDIGGRYRDPSFYARFGTAPGAVAPLENACLKLFHVLFVERPRDTAGLVRAYARVFPDESDAVDALVSETLLGQRLPRAPEIWLANPAFQTGTTVFDQFRALPRVHTFDVNAASELDWWTVPGVTPALARQLVESAPYASLEAVLHVPGVDGALRERLRTMATGMARLRSGADGPGLMASIWNILRAFLWRALFVFVAAAALGALLYRLVRPVKWWRATLAAATASALVLILTWIVVGPGWLPLAAPVLCFGSVPAARAALRRREATQVVRVLAGWLVAALPAALLARAWF